MLLRRYYFLSGWIFAAMPITTDCEKSKIGAIVANVNQLNNLPKAKKEFPRLAEVPSQVLQQTIKQLHIAWAFFQKRGFGFPRFKKYGQFKSLLFPQFTRCPVSNNHLILPKLGAVFINLHRPMPSGFVVKQVRIMRKADKWYAVVNIECGVSVPDPMPYGHPIGVDVGLDKFLATSDNVLVRPPKFFKSRYRQLKSLQCRLSRKKKRSKNYEKARLKVARLHHKIDNTRKDFHFKQAHMLCDSADMVFMENLDYRVSAKGMFGKHMLSAAFGQFRSIVKYVCWKRGKFFSEVDARGTSQECPECRGEVKKDLSLRIHNCPHCGYTTHRDVAAGQVIRHRGMELISTSGLGGKETVCAAELPGVGSNSTPRQVAKPRKGDAGSRRFPPRKEARPKGKTRKSHP
jgi:putative transposase